MFLISADVGCPAEWCDSSDSLGLG